MNNISEVACFRQQQALQEQAAYQELYGLAVASSHASITVSMAHVVHAH